VPDRCRREFRKRRIEYACADVCDLRSVVPKPLTAALVLDKGTLNALRCEQARRPFRTRPRTLAHARARACMRAPYTDCGAPRGTGSFFSFLFFSFLFSICLA
jgi:hypothetical protein